MPRRRPRRFRGENVTRVMNDAAKGEHDDERAEEDGRRRNGGEGGGRILYFLCIAAAAAASCGGVIYRFTSPLVRLFALRPPSRARTRRRSSFHGILRRVLCATCLRRRRRLAAREVQGDNRIRHRYTTNRGAEGAAAAPEDAGHKCSTP